MSQIAPVSERNFQLLSNEQVANFPVAHISNSTIRAYLSDRQSFFKRYIRQEFESTKGQAMVEGSLFHSVLELYWQEHKDGKQDKFSVAAALQSRVQQFEIDKQFNDVNWGADGSKEGSIATVEKALGFYFEELPEWTSDQVYGIETRFLSDFEDLEGNSMPIPLKGFLDLIVKEEEDFIIEDHKLVGKITPQEKPCPAYEIQACEYWFLTRKVLGINPKRMVFRQTKKSKNACELNIEEIEALFEKNGLEFEEVSEKTQLIEIFKFNNISEVTIPEHVKLIADLAVADIKKVLEEKGIEFAKGAKKDELIKACAENGIIDTIIPTVTLEIEKLKAKEMKTAMESLGITPNTKSKKQQMVELGIENGLIKLDPQVVPYVIEYDQAMLERFLELYRRIVKELSGQPLIDENTGIIQFLPNPYAAFGAEESWLDFSEEVGSGKVWTLSDIRATKPNRFEDVVDALDL